MSTKESVPPCHSGKKVGMSSPDGSTGGATGRLGLGGCMSRKTMGATVLLSDPSKDSSLTLLLSHLNDEILCVGVRVELLQTSVLELSLWRPEGQFSAAVSHSLTC